MMRVSAKRFTCADEAGYEFTVDAQHDEEWGWSASVSFYSHGLVSDAAAIMKLREACVRFLAMTETDAETGEVRSTNG